MKKASLLLFLNLLLSFISCNSIKPESIPKDKESFIGLWSSHSGFQMEIDSSGIAKVIPITNPSNKDYDKLDVGITPEYAKVMFIGFLGDSALSLRRPNLIYRTFKINRNPYLEGDSTKMILNGVILTKQ